MSILLELRGITPADYERCVAGELGNDSPFAWTRETERVGKWWEVIFRVLAGRSGFQPGLAAIAVGNGWPVDDPNEAGYGPAYVLSPREVAHIAPALAAVSDDEFRSRYSAADFTGLYHNPAGAPNGCDLALHAFHALRDFYSECAEAGDGVLKFLG